MKNLKERIGEKIKEGEAFLEDMGYTYKDILDTTDDVWGNANFEAGFIAGLKWVLKECDIDG